MRMGFSVTLSHVIMVIASVSLASAFAAYAFYMGNNVQNALMQNVNDYKMMVNMRVKIVYATINSSSNPPHFIIYAKNVGYVPLNNFTFLDVYAGKYGELHLFTYSPYAGEGSGKFSLSTANGDLIWEPRETAVIRAYPSSALSGQIFEVKVIPWNGVGDDYIFPAPAP